MIYLYNTATGTYANMFRQAFKNIAEYLAGEEEDVSNYKVLIAVNMIDLFTEAKTRTALRARFAKKDGKSLVEEIAMTDDERYFFDQKLPTGAAEVLEKLSAWTKSNTDGFKYDVTFGPVVLNGTIDFADNTLLTDTVPGFVASSLKGYVLVITTAGNMLNQEREISDNDITSITLSLPFEGDVTGLTYSVYENTEKYMLFNLTLDAYWDANMLLGAETAVREALIIYIMKEWYLINRLMEDYEIEEVQYQKELTKINERLSRRKTPYHRSGELFS